MYVQCMNAHYIHKMIVIKYIENIQIYIQKYIELSYIYNYIYVKYILKFKMYLQRHIHVYKHTFTQTQIYTENNTNYQAPLPLDWGQRKFNKSNVKFKKEKVKFINSIKSAQIDQNFKNGQEQLADMEHSVPRRIKKKLQHSAIQISKIT